MSVPVLAPIEGVQILKRTEDWLAVYKPSRVLVHQSRMFQEEGNCRDYLQNQLGLKLHPVHRLDRATSGLLLFGTSREAAGRVSKLFVQKRIRKTYFAVVRGYLEGQGTIDKPLRPETWRAYKPALTRYRSVATVEAGWGAGRYKKSRYSLIELQPLTGRFHQIRKHLAGFSHPIIGDTIYGDGAHNRAFRENLGVHGLLLVARQLEFSDPRTDEKITLTAPWNDDWQKVLQIWEWTPFFENPTVRNSPSTS